MKTHRFVLAAGGTGGHVFPAISLAEVLTKRGHEVLYITDPRGFDLLPVDKSWTVECIPAATLSVRGLLPKLKALWCLLKSVLHARILLKSFDAGVIVGFGGYPTVAPVLAAFFNRQIIIIHEQNAIIGRANRWLSRIANVMATSFEGTLGAETNGSETIRIGNPVRAEIINARTTPYPSLNENSPINILVIGGSLGAKVLSQVVPEAILLLPDDLRKNIMVTQQCREDDIALVKSIYSKAKQKSEIKVFFGNISEKIRDAHLVISRSGASTIAELSVVGRPAIFVPYKFAADDHQHINANSMVKAGGAWSFREVDLNSKNLAKFLKTILLDSKKLITAANAAYQCGVPNSAELFADFLNDLSEKNTPQLQCAAFNKKSLKGDSAQMSKVEK
jgi:UDP-N-acetylglucosamine--N-acetylmuramyl-(pentapeptide) pyrophosphoryl-undecaprenol N-acetylglucosamine transferase